MFILCFHIAIDMTCDLIEATEAVIRCQCCRILTSGGYATAEEGIDNIKNMIQQVGFFYFYGFKLKLQLFKSQVKYALKKRSI